MVYTLMRIHRTYSTVCVQQNADSHRQYDTEVLYMSSIQEYTIGVYIWSDVEPYFDWSGFQPSG